MGVQIIADSGSDILPSEAAKWDIRLIALTVRFNDEEFFDGETLSREEFYRRLSASDELPKTSQITPMRYEEAFQKALLHGDDVVCLVLSSGVSGSLQSAYIAKDAVEEASETARGRIFIVDTRQFCGSMYIQVQYAALLRERGLGAKDIADELEKTKNRARVLAVFDTLDYLKKGGRISAVSAAAGGLLSIKPVVTIEDGEVKVIGKARGSKSGNNMLRQLIHKAGIDWEKPVVFSYTGLTREKLDKYIEDNTDLYEGHFKDGIPISHVGATIGTYTGPGCIACSFYQNSEGLHL